MAGELARILPQCPFFVIRSLHTYSLFFSDSTSGFLPCAISSLVAELDGHSYLGSVGF